MTDQIDNVRLKYLFGKAYYIKTLLHCIKLLFVRSIPNYIRNKLNIFIFEVPEYTKSEQKMYQYCK